MACCTVATAAKRAARRCSSSISSVVNELHRNRPSYHARFHSFVEKEANCSATFITVVERPVIHVHADERISLAAIESPRKSHRVIEGILAMIETVRDAFAQMSGNFFLKIGSHVLADDMSTERKRKAGLLQPPGSHVRDKVKALVLISQLAFVDEQTGVNASAEHRLFDLIEG